MTSFFVSVLVSLALLGVNPPEGWMQNETEFFTKTECEAFIPAVMPIIAENIMIWSGGLGQILKVECLTEQEWYDRNVEFGHIPPPDWEPKSSRPKKPEGT